MDILSEIAELKKQIANLEAQIVDLRANAAPKVLPPPTPIERGVTVSQPVMVSGFQMCSDDELYRLADIVEAKYPQFLDTSGPGFYGSKEERQADWDRQHKAVFGALGAFKRLNEPDHKKALSYHKSAVEAYLRSKGNPLTLRVGPFMAAVLSHGDILVSGIAMQHSGHLVEIGLTLPDYPGRPATDSWRNILRTGQLPPLAPVPLRQEWNPRDLSGYAG